MTSEARPSLALYNNTSPSCAQENTPGTPSPDLVFSPNWHVFLPTRCLSSRLNPDSENSRALVEILEHIEKKQHPLSRSNWEEPHTESLSLIRRNWEEISGALYRPDTHFSRKPQCFIEVALHTEMEHFGQPDIIGVTGTGDVIILEIGRKINKSGKVRKYEKGMKAIFNGRTEKINLYPLVANYSFDSISRRIIISYPTNDSP